MNNENVTKNEFTRKIKELYCTKRGADHRAAGAAGAHVEAVLVKAPPSFLLTLQNDECTDETICLNQNFINECMDAKCMSTSNLKTR